MMMLVNRMARRVFESSSLVTNTSMVQITTIESAKISSCPNGTDPSAAEDRRAERYAAAENAPVERPTFARLQPDQQHADDRNRRDHQPQQKYRLA